MTGIKDTISVHSYSLREAAQVLGLSRQRVAQMVEAGDIEAVKTSLGWLISPEELARVQIERQARVAVHLATESLIREKQERKGTER